MSLLFPKASLKHKMRAITRVCQRSKYWIGNLSINWIQFHFTCLWVRSCNIGRPDSKLFNLITKPVLWDVIYLQGKNSVILPCINFACVLFHRKQRLKSSRLFLRTLWNKHFVTAEKVKICLCSHASLKLSPFWILLSCEIGRKLNEWRISSVSFSTACLFFQQPWRKFSNPQPLQRDKSLCSRMDFVSSGSVMNMDTRPLIRSK